MPWIVIPLEHGVHVLPNETRGRHELDRGCHCGPVVELADPETGQRFRSPVVTHREAAQA